MIDPARNWRKSSRSGGSGGNCVEWAHTPSGVSIRDSKDPHGPELDVSDPEWSKLVTAVAASQLHPWVTQEHDGVRLGKDGKTLTFTPAEWAAFIDAARLGECELAEPTQVNVGSA